MTSRYLFQIVVLNAIIGAITIILIDAIFYRLTRNTFNSVWWECCGSINVWLILREDLL